ncbi:MAG: 2OG-Fe(II) oxygenase [Rhodospirillum sp.]|nr:2OG-Fe(II) oxygenase [Rhodospirillum sp.]MCF8488335.1 2OG-Fe(II) oxygenase [Rhodospirillum sp.]MCF8500756.1 2OG-Fe(II) oxygenase [Rhodospirillum sp.]
MEEIKAAFLSCLEKSDRRSEPYTHWIIDDCLPENAARAMVSLPVTPACIGDTQGQRATNNDSRVHFGPEFQDQHAIIAALSKVFQDPEVVDKIEKVCGVDLTGNFLRMEYCQDTDGFWLEPHTDIGAKKFTMLIYLSEHEEAADWGTDIYANAETHLGSTPCGFNKGIIFIPGDDTWHGFEKRPIRGVRKTIMLNYVIPEWRSRHELCYTDVPV